MDLKPRERKNKMIDILLEPSTVADLKKISETHNWPTVSELSRSILKQYIENVKAAEAAVKK